MSPLNPIAEKRVLYSLIGLLVLISLPYGGNRIWAWSMLSAWVFLTSCYALAQSGYFSGKLNQLEVISLTCFATITTFIILSITGLPFLLEPYSLSPWHSTHELFKTVAYGLLYLLLATSITSRRDVRLLVYALVLVGFVQAFYAAASVLVGEHTRATGTYPNKNHLAGLLEMSIGLGIGLMLAIENRSNMYSTGHRLRWLAGLLLSEKARIRIMLMVMAIALVLTASRGGNAAIMLSILVCGFLMLTISRRNSRATIVLLISILVIDIVLIGSYFGFEKVTNRIQETRLDQEWRIKTAKVALEMIEDRPLLGNGAGTAGVLMPQYRTADIGLRFTNIENDYLEFFAELGLLGLLLLATIVGSSLFAAIQSLRRRRSQFYKGIAFGCTVGLVALLVHSLTDFNLRIPANACVFVVLLVLAQKSLSLERH